MALTVTRTREVHSPIGICQDPACPWLSIPGPGEPDGVVTARALRHTATRGHQVLVDQVTRTHFDAKGGTPAVTEPDPVNVLTTPAGQLQAVCEFCGRLSDPTDPDDRGRISIFAAEVAGWQEAPYPSDHVHRDGSTGPQWTCPPCVRRLRNGESLMPRREPREQL